FLSNAPPQGQVEKLLRVAFRRWNVEHAFLVGKSELGFSHYEGRNYTGMMRHQTLCLLMLTFVAEHTERLRGEQSRGDDGTGLRVAERVVPGVAGGQARDESPPAQALDHRLSPAPQLRRPRISTQAPRAAKKAA